MASDEDRMAKFIHIDEHQRTDSILFGFEHELKSITVRYGDSARFEAKIRLISSSSSISIDRSLLNIEWQMLIQDIDSIQFLKRIFIGWIFDNVNNKMKEFIRFILVMIMKDYTMNRALIFLLTVSSYSNLTEIFRNENKF
jgi:hypothetical protein